MLRVEVVIPHAAFQASDFGKHAAHPDVLDKARRDASRAAKAADCAVEGLIAWVRVRHRQIWLGLGGESANRSGPSEFVDLDAGRTIPWVHGADPLTLRVVERDTPLNAARVEMLQPSIEAGEAPELADVLIADAGFLAESAAPRDPSRAVLVAAIACEVKIKTFLREHSSAEQAALIELLLENPRDWSAAAAALFDKPLKIIAGRSLKDDDKSLWKGVIDLFARRNSLAHRGKIPTQAQALACLSTSRKVFGWLDRIERRL